MRLCSLSSWVKSEESSICTLEQGTKSLVVNETIVVFCFCIRLWCFRLLVFIVDLISKLVLYYTTSRIVRLSNQKILVWFYAVYNIIFYKRRMSSAKWMEVKANEISLRNLPLSKWCHNDSDRWKRNMVLFRLKEITFLPWKNVSDLLSCVVITRAMALEKQQSYSHLVLHSWFILMLIGTLGNWCCMLSFPTNHRYNRYLLLENAYSTLSERVINSLQNVQACLVWH